MGLINLFLFADAAEKRLPMLHVHRSLASEELSK
jgi:hypothetical protein